MRKFLALLALTSVFLFGASECSDAERASTNISKASDMFEITRRVVFFNGITDKYLLSIEGRCSIDLKRDQVLAVTCKVSEGAFKKHYLGLSDNVSYFVEQLETADVSVYHYRVVFKPQAIIPDIDLRGSKKELQKDRY